MFHQRAESLQLNGPDAARRFFAGLVAESDLKREHVWVAHVDEDARCIHLMRHDGRNASADLPIRQIIFDAAVHGSTGLVLAHNHPTGDPTPSAEDCSLTRRLALLGEAMEVSLIDHLIFGGSECRSMRAMGLL